MKKIDRIDAIEICKSYVTINGIPMRIGENIEGWLQTYVNVDYTSNQFMINVDPDSEKYEFVGEKGISIYAEKKIINSINVFPFIPNDSRYYQGDVYIFDKKIPKPFLSDDIELYFPGLELKQPDPYWGGRFNAHQIIEYDVDDGLVIEIMINRQPQYVGGVFLKAKQ